MQIGAYAPYYAKTEAPIGRITGNGLRNRTSESSDRNDNTAMQRLLDGLRQDEVRLQEKNARLWGLRGSSDILQRMRDMSIRGTLNESDSADVKKEISELRERLRSVTDAARSYYRDAEREFAANLFSSYKLELYTSIMDLAKKGDQGRNGEVMLLA